MVPTFWATLCMMKNDKLRYFILSQWEHLCLPDFEKFGKIVN